VHDTFKERVTKINSQKVAAVFTNLRNVVSRLLGGGLGERAFMAFDGMISGFTQEKRGVIFS